jgi:hypothetical protein
MQVDVHDGTCVELAYFRLSVPMLNTPEKNHEEREGN